MHPTQPASRALTLNAILLYILAYLVTIIMHETGHALLALALDGRPILYSTSVQNANKHLADSAIVLIAAAGPLLSLLQGASLLAWLRHRPVAGTWGLFWLYMAVFGLINFLGYLLIAPVVKGGDTGQLVARLHVPAAVTWAVAALSLYVLIKVIGSTAPLFLGLLPSIEQVEVNQRTVGLRRLILWPWLVGSVVLVLLALPAPHPAVIANMFMSPMVLRRAYINGLRIAPVPAVVTGLLRWQWRPALVGVVVVRVFKLLAHGWAW